jgi:hypothetical protein
MPARFRDILRVVEEYGKSYERPGRGSHWKIFDPKTGVSYRIPAHNKEKTEIDDIYVRALCRQFGFDYKKFKERL